MKRLTLIRGRLWPMAVPAGAVVVALIAYSPLLRIPTEAWAGPSAEGARTADRPGVVCYGTVDLEHGVTLLAPLQPGRVSEVLVRENQSVPQGAELLRLDDEASRGRVAEAEAAVKSSRQQLEQARKLPEKHRDQVAQQEKLLEAARARTSLARQILAQRQRSNQPAVAAALEIATSELQVREAEALEQAEAFRLAELKGQDLEAGILRAEYELAAAEARLGQARSALAECRLKAPRAGTLLRINVGPGDVLGPDPRQPAILFAAEGPQVIRATVEQEFAARVKEGMAAQVQDETDESRTWSGKVERVAGWFSQRRTVLHDPSQMSDVRTLECLVVLDTGQPPLRLGQSVRVLIGNVPR